MTGVRRLVSRGVLPATLVTLGACGGEISGPAGERGGSSLVVTTEVTVADFSFTPPAIVVSPGATVIWTWASGTHNVTFAGGEMTSHATESAPWIRGSLAPSTAGTYGYSCTLHPSQMTGSITVVP